VELTIKEILAIDKNAENLRKNNEALLENMKKELENELKSMSDNLDDELLREKIRIMNENINAAKLEAEYIIKQKDAEINEITARYNLVKSGLIHDLFTELKNYIREG
jgi:hypothetical protein